MARVKGFALRGLLKSVKDSGGSIPAVLTALPDAERATFDRPIVASGWYPYAAFVALVRAIDRIQGKSLTASRERFFTGRLEGFPEIDRAHCLLIEGWLEGLGHALAAVGMTSRQVRCVHRGDAACEFEGAWEADRPGGWLG